MNDDGQIIFNRPPRIQRALPKGSVEIPTPPAPQFKGSKLDWALLISPVVVAVGTLIAMVLVTVLRPNSNILFLLTIGVTTSGLIFAAVLGMIQKFSSDRTNRKEFLELLEERENELKSYARQQQTLLHYLYPALPQIINWPQSRYTRLWERRIEDDDFLSLRLGIGSRPNAIEVGKVRTDKKIPLLDQAVALSNTYQEVQDVPDIVVLNEVAFVGLVGEPEQTTPIVRSMICHLAAHHSPEEVKIVVTHSPRRASEWFWAGWLPHNRISASAGGDIPMISSYSDQMETLANFLLETIKQRDNQRHNLSSSLALSNDGQSKSKLPYMFPNIIWVVDDFELVQDEPAIKKLFEMGAELGVYLITTARTPFGIPPYCRAVIEVLPNGRVRYSTSGTAGRVVSLQPDLAPLEYCEQFADAIAPLKLKASSDKGEFASSLRLLDLLGIDVKDDKSFDPLVLWNRSSVGQLRVPVGLVFGGQELFLDVSDKGHGPHGLIAGTTGSGKSELLLSVVSALALSNHPDNLNFVLGDFKGGATFNPFVNLPHVVGMMSDLDLTIVERAMTAIFSELKRREHLLKEEGVTHIRDYQKKKPMPKEPMPYLIMIIDEFAEMKEQAPDFMDKIVNIARTGRTLGVHLILATQRPAGVITGQLNSNTKFRLCLRVETTDDSADMLGRKDAAMIPNGTPGRAFFKVGSDVFEQFQVARVAVPFAQNGLEAEQEDAIVTVVDQHWRARALLPPTQKKAGGIVEEKEGVEVMD